MLPPRQALAASWSSPLLKRKVPPAEVSSAFFLFYIALKAHLSLSANAVINNRVAFWR